MKKAWPSSRTIRWRGGLLTGKHKQSEVSAGRFTLGNAGSMYQARYWHDREFQTIEDIRALAKDAGLSMTTLAVAWVLANPAITSPIIGASKPEQLADNLAAVERRARRRSQEETRRADGGLAVGRRGAVDASVRYWLVPGAALIDFSGPRCALISTAAIIESFAGPI